VIFTAPDTGVTVIKGIVLGTLGTVDVGGIPGYLSCQFSGGAEAVLAQSYCYGAPEVYPIQCWTVMTPGSQLLLYGDGTNIFTVTVDGAILVDTP